MWLPCIVLGVPGVAHCLRRMEAHLEWVQTYSVYGAGYEVQFDDRARQFKTFTFPNLCSFAPLHIFWSSSTFQACKWVAINFLHWTRTSEMRVMCAYTS